MQGKGKLDLRPIHATEPRLKTNRLQNADPDPRDQKLLTYYPAPPGIRPLLPAMVDLSFGDLARVSCPFWSALLVGSEAAECRIPRQA